MDGELEERLADFDRRLARLERLAFLSFQDIRAVARYAYENVALEVDAEEVRPLPHFHSLSDQEAVAIGLGLHELSSLKATMRLLRKQVRRDALGIVRDLIRVSRRELIRPQKEDAA